MGIEPTAKTAENPVLSDEGGAKSGALVVEKDEIHPEIAKLGESWLSLPEPMRKAILAMIDTTR